MAIYVQNLGSFLSLSRAQARVAIPKLGDTVNQVRALIEVHAPQLGEAADKLSDLSKPRSIADGARIFKSALKTSEALRLATAEHTEIDPHWMDLALLRAANCSDALVDGVQQYFLSRNQVLVADPSAYSIESVQKTVKACQKLGLLELILAAGTNPTTITPEMERSVDEIIAEYRSFVERKQSWFTYDVLVRELREMNESLVDHPIFAELWIKKDLVIADSRQQVDEGIEEFREAHSKTSQMRLIIASMVVPHYAGENPMTIPEVGRYSRESVRVQRLHIKSIRRLPADHPRRVLFSLLQRADKILEKKAPANLFKKSGVRILHVDDDD